MTAAGGGALPGSAAIAVVAGRYVFAVRLGDGTAPTDGLVLGDDLYVAMEIGVTRDGVVAEAVGLEAVSGCCAGASGIVTFEAGRSA